MRLLLTLFLLILSIQSYAQFTYSGYIYNANGSGAVNVPVKLYRRTIPNITGFTSQQNYNGHSYYRSTGNAFWLNAKSNCEAMGGHLVTVTTAAENNFIFNIWPSGWIGLTDEVNEGTWRWVTGETYSYTSWNPGEPNNAGNEDYVQFVGSGKWNDLPNGVSLPYVLEFEYIVTTTAWTLYKTVYTNSTGRFTISETYDPSKEYYIVVNSKTPTTSLTNSDGKLLGEYSLGSRTKNGLTFHVFDLNSDNRINVSDQFLLFGKKSGLFLSWGSLPISKLYTSSDKSSYIRSIHSRRLF